MADKQIIIDYKNLCENYSKEVGCYGTFDGSCIKEQCFTYKLLQQNNNLKKENIDLKLNLKKVINLSQKKNRQCYQFLADIKQLKHQHQADKGLITSTGKMNYQLLQEYDKLKTALTEIKEIARVNSINTCWTAINLCVDCDEIKECGLQSPFEKLKAIIQKISECEGSDETTK